MPVTDDIHARVMNVLAEVLAVDQADITPTMSLQRDLGADSLDLLEIMSRLEHEFDIEISRGKVWPELVHQLHPEWVQNGKLTDKGLAELRGSQPCADSRGFAITDLVTVDLLGAYVESKLAAVSDLTRNHVAAVRVAPEAEGP